MLCPICGSVIEDNDRECTICGYLVEAGQDNTVMESVGCTEQEVTDIIQSDTLSAEETQNTTKNSKNVMLIGVLVALVLMIAGFSYWYLSDDSSKNENDNTIKESTESKTEVDGQEGDQETEAININDFVGYWNIQGNSEKELTIHNGDDSTVVFSLWYYKKDEISDVSAKMKDNVASFSAAIDGAAIKGTLTFKKGIIIVQITHSGREDMPIEIMEFNERHMKSWVYTKNGASETTNMNNSYSGSGYDVNEYYDYILPYSSDRLLTDEDVYLLSKDELKLARNEIYARNGRKFKDSTLQAYFDAKAWYFGYIEPANFSESMLSDIERANVELIQSYEK